MREVTIDDALSALFAIDVVALCENAAVDFEAVIGRPATFRIDEDIAAEAVGKIGRAWTGILLNPGEEALQNAVLPGAIGPPGPSGPAGGPARRSGE